MHNFINQTFFLSIIHSIEFRNELKNKIQTENLLWLLALEKSFQKSLSKEQISSYILALLKRFFLNIRLLKIMFFVFVPFYDYVMLFMLNRKIYFIQRDTKKW